MWLYRRMLKISWTDRISNQRVLEKMGKQKELLNTIKTRKLEYIEHIMSKLNQRYNVLQLILQEKIEGKRSVGRRRISWMKNLRDWYNITSIELFRASLDRNDIANIISNIRNGEELIEEEEER
uniref:Uncharacterized protein n=1 Tax=Sipha flava TaxID=143950 RepID=A0A2S2QJK3_9HEMI